MMIKKLAMVTFSFSFFETELSFIKVKSSSLRFGERSLT